MKAGRTHSFSYLTSKLSPKHTFLPSLAVVLLAGTPIAADAANLTS